MDITSASFSRECRNIEDVAALDEHLQLGLNDPSLLRLALSYRTAERRGDLPDVRRNERLEFLGDAVLGFAASSYIFEHFPDLTEGELTRMRAGLVSAHALGAWAQDLGLDQWIDLDPSNAARPGGRNVDRLRSSVLEAIAGVVYLQRGVGAVQEFFKPRLEAQAPLLRMAGRSPKNRLQELVQAHGGPAPVYRVTSETGPPHARVYTVDVLHHDLVIGSGSGNSKAAAQVAAAQHALVHLEPSPPVVGAPAADGGLTKRRRRKT